VKTKNCFTDSRRNFRAAQRKGKKEEETSGKKDEMTTEKKEEEEKETTEKEEEKVVEKKDGEKKEDVDEPPLKRCAGKFTKFVLLPKRFSPKKQNFRTVSFLSRISTGNIKMLFLFELED
jgi:hypothetical protein